MTRASRPALLGTALAAVLALAACGGADDGAAAAPGGAEGGATAGSAPGALSVVAAFYPLQFLTERVGGDRVEVTGLTPPGAEAHDLELSPRSLAGLSESDLVVVLGGFQAAVDEALGGVEVPVVDLVAVADRELGEDEVDQDEVDQDEVDQDEAGATHSEGDGHDHGGTDPHFWTDPTRMAEAAGLLADALTEADPDGAAAYAANAEALVAELTTLDEEARAAFTTCEVDTLVTAHDAFGYFADRYGFELRPINGITPDQEPDARTQAEVSDFVAENGITTVYTETLVSAAIAETVATEAGVDTAVLDPVEGLTDASAGEDYLEVMRANIDAVRTGQVCT